MEIRTLTCPACGAPIKLNGTTRKATCEYCGHEIVIESKDDTIVKAQSITQREIRDLKRSQEISMAQLRLSNIQAEKRSIESDHNRKRRKQLQQINEEENELLQKIDLLEAESRAEIEAGIVDTEDSDSLINTTAQVSKGISEKSRSTALWLAIFMGPLGIHRFYTGHVFTGILQLLSFGGFMIWWIVDIIAIATGKFRDSTGRLLDPNRKGNPVLKKIIIWIFVWQIAFYILEASFSFPTDETLDMILLMTSIILAVTIVNIQPIIKFFISIFQRIK